MNPLTPAAAPASPTVAGPNVQLKRHPERGSHERERVFAIIDEAMLAHVAFSVDGQAMTLPTAHARIGDQLYLHGAKANRALLALCAAERASVTFTLLDGLVFARTAFHHSMNYRSAVVLGRASEVVDLDEKRLALHALVEHIAPGRMRELSSPSAGELSATLVVRIDIEEASAKQRAGDPVDTPRDLTLDVWAGTVPLTLAPGTPRADGQLRAGQVMSEAAFARALPRPASVVTREYGDYTLTTDPARLQIAYIHRFLSQDSYWAKDLELETFRASLHRSLNFGVYHGREQVGFARVISDCARFAYLGDVFVDAAHRGRGVGRTLVELALEHPAVRDVERWLVGTLDAHTLYERFGFKRMAEGRYMLKRR
jgi:nitroimidazol reductase NimA-like FMN-containing flavoprotein (pyridoxamine 5'-phosphate oxidase superfamily)/GNAT superfamily N-acetyltransferase